MREPAVQVGGLSEYSSYPAQAWFGTRAKTDPVNRITDWVRRRTGSGVCKVPARLRMPAGLDGTDEERRS